MSFHAFVFFFFFALSLICSFAPVGGRVGRVRRGTNGVWRGRVVKKHTPRTRDGHELVCPVLAVREGVLATGSPCPRPCRNIITRSSIRLTTRVSEPVADHITRRTRGRR